MAHIWDLCISTPFISPTLLLPLSTVSRRIIAAIDHGLKLSLIVNVGMQSFVYGEFLSLAIAKVWSGTAELPSTSALWRWYEKEWKRRKGYGKHFQFLGADRTRGKRCGSRISSPKGTHLSCREPSVLPRLVERSCSQIRRETGRYKPSYLFEIFLNAMFQINGLPEEYVQPQSSYHF